MADKFLNLTGLSYFWSKITNALSGKANIADLPGEATDSTLGLVKTNSAESILLNSNGQLDVGGRLGQMANTSGIYHPKTAEPRNVANYSFMVTDAKGMNIGAARVFGILTGYNVTLTKSHAAGSTSYTVANNYENRIRCSVLIGGGFVALSEADAVANRVVYVDSVTIDGQSFTPDSSANDSSKPITINVSSSVNPDSATNTIRIFGSITGGYCSQYIGQDVGGASGVSLVIGQNATTKSGNGNVMVGLSLYNAGNGNSLFGRQIISTKNRWLLVGTGHDNTNGKSEAGVALGQWSNITANTVLAVGNGTNQTNRSNTFEILADGRIKSNGTPTENDDLTTKAYVDSAIGGGGLAITAYGNADFSYQQELDPDTQEVINECVAYSTVAGNVNEPKAVKYGRVVNMSGAFKNINARPSNATFVMGKVPSGCEPLYNQYIMQQGSSQYKYLLQIQTDGTMSCQRYSASASAIAVTNNAWLNINATYVSAS